MQASKATLADKLRALTSLKVRKRGLADEEREINARIAEVERDAIALLLDMADASGMDDPGAFTVAVDGRRYGVTTKTYYNITADAREAAFAALREVGLGDIIVERVDPRTLTSTLEQIAEDNGGALPDEYAAIPMSVYSESKISDRKLGGRP